MIDIEKTIEQLRLELEPFGARLIAVSKTRQHSEIAVALHAGQLDFGENYVQELVEKQPLLPNTIRWHFIGHLQTNKVKFIAGFVHMIHTVDSMKLLREINKQAAKFNRTIPCLLQLHIAQEETKFGLSKEEAVELLTEYEKENLENVSIVGLMGMATNSDNEAAVEAEFKGLKLIFDDLQITYPQLKVLSMGMSSDYKIAMRCGSTMVRIGSTIFGERTYPANK